MSPAVRALPTSRSAPSFARPTKRSASGKAGGMGGMGGVLGDGQRCGTPGRARHKEWETAWQGVACRQGGRGERAEADSRSPKIRDFSREAWSQGGAWPSSGVGWQWVECCGWGGVGCMWAVQEVAGEQDGRACGCSTGRCTHQPEAGRSTAPCAAESVGGPAWHATAPALASPPLQRGATAATRLWRTGALRQGAPERRNAKALKEDVGLRVGRGGSRVSRRIHGRRHDSRSSCARVQE